MQLKRGNKVKLQATILGFVCYPLSTIALSSIVLNQIKQVAQQKINLTNILDNNQLKYAKQQHYN